MFKQAATEPWMANWRWLRSVSEGKSEHLELLGFNTSYIIRMWHGHIHNSQYVSQNKDR